MSETDAGQVIHSKQRIEILASGIDDLREAVDKSQFDMELAGDSLEYDPKQIIDFVTTQITFEPYPGLLRGARNTLMSRAGNSLDQSVLLATLLKDAGYDARIARGRLSEAQSRNLLKQLSPNRKFNSPFYSDTTAESIFLDLATALGVPEADARKLITPPEQPTSLRDTTEYRETQNAVAMLTELLDEAGYSITMATPAIDEQIEEESRDYFWVQYKESSDRPWSAAHVAFEIVPESLLQNIKATEVFAGAIPIELQHRIRFTAYIDQKLGSEIKTHLVVGPYERPSANLANVPVELSILPLDIFALENFSGESLQAAIKNSTIYVANLSDGSPNTTAFFDMDGNLIDPMAGSNPAAGVFQSIGNRIGQAAGAVDGGDPPDDFVRLEKIWVKYELIRPNNELETVTRTVFSWADAIEDQQSNPRVQIGQSLTFMVATGAVPPALIADMNLEKLQSMMPMLNYLLSPDSEDNTDNVKELNADLNSMQAQWIGHLQLFALFDEGHSLFDQGAHSYRSGTNILAYQESFSPSEPEIAIDVVSNERRAFRPGESGMTFSKDLMTRIGVWETAVEGVLTRRLGRKEFNTFVALQEAEAAGVELAVIAPGDDLSQQRLQFSREVLANVEADLDRGNLVVIPRRLPTDSTATGWWRIDRDTGQTLGVGEDGRGVDITSDMVTRVIQGSMISGALCTGFMKGSGASTWTTVSQCGKFALAVGGAVAGVVYYQALTAAATQAAALWQGGAVGGLILNAVFELMTLVDAG